MVPCSIHVDLAGTVLVYEHLVKLCKELFKEFCCKVAMVIVKVESDARLTDKIMHSRLKVFFRYCPAKNASSLLLAFNRPYEDTFLEHIGLQLVVLMKDNKGAKNDQYGLATMYIDYAFCWHPCEPCMVVHVAIRLVEKYLGHN